MADFPAMPLWFDAYWLDCSHLSDAEHGRYLLIMKELWTAPKQRIPNDDEWLARKFRRSVDAIKTEIRPILDEFCECSGNWWSQKRLTRELAYVRARGQKQSARAKSRWNKEKDACRGNALTPTIESESVLLSESLERITEKKDSPPLSPKGERKKRKHLWPDGFVLTPDLRNYAESKAAGCDAAAMWDQFENHHRAKGSMFVDWERAWFTWVNSPYEKPMNGNGAIHERTCAVSGRANQPGGPNKKPGSFVEASRQVLALRSRQS
jgi:uncharacterized protein YdaU (DUF1376 family)